MAMVDLATRQTLGCECGPICLAEIAARQKLSQAYLEQLFGKLRRAGLVDSARGPGGGYRLAYASDTMTIADIVAAVDEPMLATRTKDDSETGLRCPSHDLWDELGRQIRMFRSSTMSLARKAQGRSPTASTGCCRPCCSGGFPSAAWACRCT